MPADLVLSLDGSTPVLSASLLRREGRSLRVLATFSAAPPVVASTVVPGCFDTLLAQAGARIDDVGVLVAGLGPGLFTGLRTALATMKAIAYARKLPLLGAGSLEALSYTETQGRTPVEGDVIHAHAVGASTLVAPVLDARKGETYAAVHRWTDAGLVIHTPAFAPKQAEFREFLAALGEPVVVVGTGAATLGELPPNVTRANVEPTPSSATIAALALAATPDPAFDLAHVLAVEPFYLRPPEAEVARQKRLDQQKTA